jgi:predicted DsbA family dithiol-disulfide isomerase
MTLMVHIWSDIACPWCYVGKRHLEAALHQFAHAAQTQLIWHAFELDPSAPKQSAAEPSYVERLARKYGTSTTQAQHMIDRMTERGRAVQIDFRFANVQFCNTFDAHRLLKLALEEGAAPSASTQTVLTERLFAAYMTEGELISDKDTLLRLAREVGLNEEEAYTTLHTDAFFDDVRADELAARRLGVTGVPFFVLGRYGVAGAQPPDVLLSVLEQAWTGRNTAGTDRALE